MYINLYFLKVFLVETPSWSMQQTDDGCWNVNQTTPGPVPTTPGDPYKYCQVNIFLNFYYILKNFLTIKNSLLLLHLQTILNTGLTTEVVTCDVDSNTLCTPITNTTGNANTGVSNKITSCNKPQTGDTGNCNPDTDYACAVSYFSFHFSNLDRY